MLADRIYGTIKGMEHVLSCKGDFVLRYRMKAFKVYDEDRKKLELIKRFRNLRTHESMSVSCYYDHE